MMVDEICPKFPAGKNDAGFPKEAWLNALNASARNSNRMVSRSGKLLKTLRSTLVNPGPWYLPTPQLPKFPVGCENAAGFSHNPVRGLSEAPALPFPMQSGLGLNVPVCSGLVLKSWMVVPVWLVTIVFN